MGGVIQAHANHFAGGQVAGALVEKLVLVAHRPVANVKEGLDQLAGVEYAAGVEEALHLAH